jgi:hypothetical protein
MTQRESEGDTVGRKQINGEQTPARFAAGTLRRIDAVLKDGEKRSDLLRQAVARELARREQHVKRDRQRRAARSAKD